MCFLPKWSLPYRLKLYGNIFVSQMPTLIPGIKVEFFAFLFLGKLLIWLTDFVFFKWGVGDWAFAQIVPCSRQACPDKTATQVATSSVAEFHTSCKHQLLL